MIYVKKLAYCLLLFFLIGCSLPKASYDEYTDIDTTYPLQTRVTAIEPIIITKGKNTYTLYPQAEYQVGAYVRRKKRYRFDRMAQLSPIDLALFWGPSVQPNFQKQLTVRQSKRRYWFFLKRNATMSVDWVYVNSSNHHLIPANDNIRNALYCIRNKDTVLLEGYLVNVSASFAGSRIAWNSSLTRTDRGDGACEILYVTKVKRNYRVYE